MNTSRRKPLSYRGPFKRKQFEHFRGVFIECAQSRHQDPGTLFDQLWPGIREAALVYEREMSLRYHEQHSVSEQAAALRSRKRNRFRALREAAKKHDAAWLSENHPERVNALLYGAMRANVATSLKQLQSLEPQALQAAVNAAISDLSVPKGRPDDSPLVEYAHHVAEAYRTARRCQWVCARYDDTTRERRGLALNFFKAAFAPLNLPHTSHGWGKLIERTNKPRKQPQKISITIQTRDC